MESKDAFRNVRNNKLSYLCTMYQKNMAPFLIPEKKIYPLLLSLECFTPLHQMLCITLDKARFTNCNWWPLHQQHPLPLLYDFKWPTTLWLGCCCSQSLPRCRSTTNSRQCDVYGLFTVLCHRVARTKLPDLFIASLVCELLQLLAELSFLFGCAYCLIIKVRIKIGKDLRSYAERKKHFLY